MYFGGIIINKIGKKVFKYKFSCKCVWLSSLVLWVLKLYVKRKFI